MSKTGNTDWARRLSGGAVCSAQNQWRESKQICTVLSPQHQHNMPRNRPSTDSEQAQYVGGGEGKEEAHSHKYCVATGALHSTWSNVFRDNMTVVGSLSVVLWSQSGRP